MTKTRIALIGAGLIGREHAALIGKHPEAELVAIADVSVDGRHYADSIGVPYFKSYEDMLDQTKPDGAIVALPNSLHLPAGLACIGRGVPSLIEKPIADTMDAALQLATAAETSGVAMLIGHQRRHSPDIKEARRALQDGLIGDLVSVNGMWLADKPDDYFDAAWRRQAGGGPLLINLIHDLDCLRYICGEIDSIKAFASNAVRGFHVEDSASLILRFENGALGTFSISDAVASPYTWDMASGQALYFPHQPENCYVFGGRAGTLAVPGMNLWRHAREGEHWQHPFVRHHLPLDGSRAYVNQLTHFLAVIRDEAAPVVPP
ncbi:MAG: Gfo/Idh/MocA family protein, partial [Geminicoccaceae bacterium]